MKRFICVVLAMGLMLWGLTGCAGTKKNNEDALSIVTTVFPYYDTVRVLMADEDKVSVTMLVPAGKDSHSFEPTIQDMMTVQKADVLLYNSALTEHWMTKVLEAAPNKERIDLAVTSGMNLQKVADHDNHDDHDDHDHEYEDHIWTSPKKMIEAVDAICEALCRARPDSKEAIEKRAADYKKELKKLSDAYEAAIANAKNRHLVFGDRFPFYYLCADYGLTASAAFDGCSSETEPSAGVMSSLIAEIKTNHIPVVYHIEFSSERIADTLCLETGAKKLLLHSAHTISRNELEDGMTYLKLMEQNLEHLKEGLEVAP